MCGPVSYFFRVLGSGEGGAAHDRLRWHLSLLDTELRQRRWLRGLLWEQGLLDCWNVFNDRCGWFYWRRKWGGDLVRLMIRAYWLGWSCCVTLGLNHSFCGGLFLCGLSGGNHISLKILCLACLLLFLYFNNWELSLDWNWYLSRLNLISL